MTYVLWIIQILLGLLFVFAGGTKLVMSIEVMHDMARQAGQTPLPGMLLRFIGVAELLGGLGLILPGLLRIRPGLTPLAAAGLLIIMIGAVVITLSSGPMAPALFPLIVCLLLLFVIYGRTKLAPVAPR
ncbi:MAG TPA: DoxX family protein [Pyrinomonadaceae bacterium]|nr:DoxX family protein [Pyrinomonadaceae bacterium]